MVATCGSQGCASGAERQAPPRTAQPVTPGPSALLGPTPRGYGTLSRAVIQGVIRSHIAEVRACYERGLDRDPDLEGRIFMHFMIGPSGGVDYAAVETSELSDPAVGECIADVIRFWDFPPPDGGGDVIVRYPFMLTSRGG